MLGLFIQCDERVFRCGFHHGPSQVFRRFWDIQLHQPFKFEATSCSESIRRLPYFNMNVRVRPEIEEAGSQNRPQPFTRFHDVANLDRGLNVEDLNPPFRVVRAAQKDDIVAGWSLKASSFRTPDHPNRPHFPSNGRRRCIAKRSFRININTSIWSVCWIRTVKERELTVIRTMDSHPLRTGYNSHPSTRHRRKKRSRESYLFPSRISRHRSVER